MCIYATMYVIWIQHSVCMCVCMPVRVFKVYSTLYINVHITWIHFLFKNIDLPGKHFKNNNHTVSLLFWGIYIVYIQLQQIPQNFIPDSIKIACLMKYSLTEIVLVFLTPECSKNSVFYKEPIMLCEYLFVLITVQNMGWSILFKVVDT